MKIECNLEDLKKTGVYIIINTVNNKVYIGSSIVSILKRLWHHKTMLNINKHKNSYLQRSWNKYKEDSFVFKILEICEKEKCLEVEQKWIDEYKSYNQEFGYNINPKATNVPPTDKETIAKRANTMRLRYASGELDHIKKDSIERNIKRRGIKPINTDHLKVPKTITQKVVNSRKIRIERNREEKFPKIYVYDSNYKYIDFWRSAIDLEEWSKTSFNNLPLKSRFPTGRFYKSGYKDPKILNTCNIIKSCKTNKPYKGLYFSYKPLHQVIDVEKLDKFGETPEMDNTEPTINLND